MISEQDGWRKVILVRPTLEADPENFTVYAVESGIEPDHRESELYIPAMVVERALPGLPYSDEVGTSFNEEAVARAIKQFRETIQPYIGSKQLT